LFRARLRASNGLEFSVICIKNKESTGLYKCYVQVGLVENVNNPSA